MFFFRHQQIRVSLFPAPADPAPQLVDLRQPQGMGPINDYRVGRRDVQT